MLIPNQHVGAWETGFMPQWLARDYLARRGHASFRPDQVVASRCPLLGYALDGMRIEGSTIPRWFLQVDQQPEIGAKAFDAGAAELSTFFRAQLERFETPNLDPLGQRIIDAFLADADVKEYEKLIPGTRGR